MWMTGSREILGKLDKQHAQIRVFVQPHNVGKRVEWSSFAGLIGRCPYHQVRPLSEILRNATPLATTPTIPQRCWLTSRHAG